MRDLFGKKIKKPIPKRCRCCDYTPLVCKGIGIDKDRWHVFCGDCKDVMILRWPTCKSAVKAWDKANKAVKRSTMCRLHKREARKWRKEARKRRKKEKKGR